MPKVIFNFFFFFLFLFFINFVIGFLFIPNSLDSFILNIFSSTFLELYILFDGLSLFFLWMLILCFTFSIPFTLFYYYGDLLDRYFMINCLIFFGLIMTLLVFSYGYFTTVLFWEYLGLWSFNLILYNRSDNSVRSCVITLISSRLGDVSMLMCVACSNYIFINPYYLGVFVLFCVITKSASYPLITWLVEAMRAPTPVSCLVHSSTLVTAGVWFALRYSVCTDYIFLSFLTYFSLLSVLFSGLLCLYVDNIKRVVAFSTCNNISWCLLCFCLGCDGVCVKILIVHGLAKCIMFCLVGDLFKNSFQQQSQFGLCVSSYLGLFYLLGGFIILSCLGGAPYLGVFSAKHSLLDACLDCGNVVIFLFIILGVCFSFGYTIRLFLLYSSSFYGLVFSCFVSYIWIFMFSFISSFVDSIICGMLYDDYLLFNSHNFFLFIIFLVQVFGFFIGYISFNKFLFCCGRWSSLYTLFSCDELVWSLALSGPGNSFLDWLVWLFSFRWDFYFFSVIRGFCFIFDTMCFCHFYVGFFCSSIIFLFLLFMVFL